jgi:hypothetical protein
VFVLAIEGLVHVEHGLNRVLAGGHLRQRFPREPECGRVDDDRRIGSEAFDVDAEELKRLAGVLFALICCRGSRIWSLGSPFASVESNSRTRPSVGPCPPRLWDDHAESRRPVALAGNHPRAECQGDRQRRSPAVTVPVPPCHRPLPPCVGKLGQVRTECRGKYYSDSAHVSRAK